VKVFISYAFNDKAKYETLCRALDGKVEYWNTDEIPAGEQLRDGLREAVTRCPVCVFIATKQSLESGWCLAEVGAFWGAGKPVVVYLKDTKLSDKDVPKQLQGSKWTRDPKEVVAALRVHLEKAALAERDTRPALLEYNRDSMALYAIKADALRRAETDVWMFGATMHHTLGNLTNVLVDKIAGGLRLNLLLAESTGSNFEASARSFGQTKAELHDESVRTLKGVVRLQQLLDARQGVRGGLDVRLVDEVFTAGVYFYDPAGESGRMMLVPHVPGQDAAEVPGFVFQPSPMGPLDHYYGMYQRIWKRAKPFKAWSEANPAYLAQGGPLP
jgi:hypothetical protein